MIVFFVVIFIVMIVTTQATNDFRIVKLGKSYVVKRKYTTLFLFSYWIKISYYMKYTVEAEDFIKELVYFENYNGLTSQRGKNYNIDFK